MRPIHMGFFGANGVMWPIPGGQSAVQHYRFLLRLRKSTYSQRTLFRFDVNHLRLQFYGRQFQPFGLVFITECEANKIVSGRTAAPHVNAGNFQGHVTYARVKGYPVAYFHLTFYNIPHRHKPSARQIEAARYLKFTYSFNCEIYRCSFYCAKVRSVSTVAECTCQTFLVEL